jgi:hypothetical protein
MNRFSRTRPAAQATVVPDPNATPVPAIIPSPNAVPQVATADTVTIPIFDTSGNQAIGPDGKPATLVVPANSPAAMLAANAKVAVMHTPLGMLLAGLGFGLLAFGAAYYGTRLALRRNRVKAYERSRASRQRSGGATVERA